jgi:hypothetical protein
MGSVVFPRDAAQLTPELLTAALSETRPDVLVEGLQVVEQAHCNSGSASTAGRLIAGQLSQDRSRARTTE